MKLKKIAVSLLLAACTFACACGGSGGGVAGPVTGDIVNDDNNFNYVEGMLHDVNVDFDAPVADFVVNGYTDYQIVYGTAKAGKAAGFIRTHVSGATGGEITVTDQLPTQVNSNTKYIFVGCEDLYVELGYGEKPAYSVLGLGGYEIKTVGSNVFINTCGAEDSYQLGVIAFLREVVGYDMLKDEIVIYERDGKKMPAMDITERPDFDYRAPGGQISVLEQYGMGFTDYSPIPNTGESWIHNIYDFVSLEEMDENPDWASSDVTRWQMCFTSRGNKDSYTKLVYHVAEKVKGFLTKSPSTPTIVLGQHDIGGTTPSVQNCKCKACQASYAYYGNTMGGAWLSLCNRVSVVVDEWLKQPEQIEYFGEDFEWNFLQLIYHTHLNAPTEKDQNGYILDEDGYGIPKVEMWFNNDGSMQDWEDAWTDEETGDCLETEVVKEWSDTYERIYPAPNVHHFFAASGADWVHSFLDSENAGFKNICDAWTGVSTLREGGSGGKFYIWAYTLNSEFSNYPYNSFDTFFETTRYFKEIGSKYIYWQTLNNPENSGFSTLKNYLTAKVEFDVNCDYMYYVNKFFKHAYGVAGQDIQDFFEQFQLHYRWMEEVNKVSGNIHNAKYGNKEHWPEGLINGWVDLLENAIDKVEQAYSATDPELCALYTKQIEIELQFPLLVQCTTHAGSFGDAELKAKRKYFMHLFYDVLGNKIHAEGRSMYQITDLWDLD